MRFRGRRAAENHCYLERRGSVVAAVLLAAVGCVDAGVPETSDRPLEWTFEERFRLGAQPSGPESFFRLAPNGVATDSDGRLLVLDRSNYRVVEFDSAGGFVRMFGQQGQGPGEFEFPVDLVVTPEGIGVFDAYKRGLLIFNRQGEFQERLQLEAATPNGIAFVGDALLFGARSETEDGMVRDELRVSRGGDTTVLASLVRPPSTVQDHIESCQVRMASPPVFAPVLSWSVAGRRLAVVSPPGYAIGVWNDLKHVSDIERAIEPVPSSEELARQHLGDGIRVTIGTSRTCTIPTEEVIQLRGMAPFVPVVRSVVIAPDGELWVRRYSLGGEASRTDIFDASGTYVGTLGGPHPSPVAFLPSGGVLSIEMNALGEHELVAYDVERR